jgi:hypothetical protein
LQTPVTPVSDTDTHRRITIRQRPSPLERKKQVIYIYKRLRPSKKIRNRRKKEQQKLFNSY